jgi:protein tyrosine phosphatase
MFLKQFKTSMSDIDSSKISNYNQENRSKNRYRNVVPFDYNRVKLIDKQNNDYINASHVCLPLNIFKEKELYELHYIAKFIVAQPPLNSTISKCFNLCLHNTGKIV